MNRIALVKMNVVRRIVLAAVCFTIVSGCDSSTARKPARSLATVSDSSRDYIAGALDFVERLDAFDDGQAHNEVMYHLNRWLDAQKPDSSWEPDQLVQRLPTIVRDHGALERIAQTKFDLRDVDHFQESVWCRQLATWIGRQPVEPRLARWLDEQKSVIGAIETEQLRDAVRLFDWTVRNIQLTELLPVLEAEASASGDAGNTRPVPMAMRGVAGPGYHYEPREALLYGRSDAWVRMRLFTLLCRQRGIDAVTLAFPSNSIPPRPRPWVSGVLLGKQLYLFDSRIGLPIPGQDLVGIATLEQVLKHPDLLSALDVGTDHKYGVGAEDLKELQALIDTTEAALTHRMAMLESQLAGAQRTVLSLKPTPLKQRLEACQGVEDVFFWTVPFEAVWFRLARERLRQEDKQEAARYMQEYAIFLNRSGVTRARYMYFRGQFNFQDDDPGAKQLLLDTRVTREQIKLLPTDTGVQKAMGLIRSPYMSDEMWKLNMENLQQHMDRSKEMASFWLGLIHLEDGAYDSAVHWLNDQTLVPYPNGVFTPLVRYNLARAYERQGKLDKAQETLLMDKSLNEHGNYLRARLLQKELQFQSASSPQPTKSDATP